MRIVWFSFRNIWASFLVGWRRSRRVWVTALLFVLAGVTWGVVTALFVAEPEIGSILGSIFANTYRPFYALWLSLLCLFFGVIACYISARFVHRLLFWVYLIAVGYVLGRLCVFASLTGALGILSVFLCETPFVFLPLAFVVGYQCTLADILFYTLNPKCNRRYVFEGLRYLLWGALCCLLLIVVVWGGVSAIVNIVV
jgi:hypothetical protein